MDEWIRAAWSEILVQTEGLKRANRCSPMEINKRGEGGNTRRLSGERDGLGAQLKKTRDHENLWSPVQIYTGHRRCDRRDGTPSP